MSFYRKSIEWAKGKIKYVAEKSIQGLNKYKYQALATIAITGVAVSSVGYGHHYYQSNIDTIYHVYMHGQKIGVVNDPQIVKDWMNERIEEEANKFAHVQLQIDTDFDFKPEELYKPEFDNESALAKLEDEFSLSAVAVRIEVDGEFIGYAPDEETLNSILLNLKKDYVSEEYAKALESQQKNGRNVMIASLDAEENLDQEALAANEATDGEIHIDLSLELDKPVMTQATFKESIEMNKQIVHPNQVLDEDKLKELFSQSRIEEGAYKVQSGDVLGSIASDHGLTLAELLQLNPDLDENSVLQIGQEITVEGEQPVLTVVTYEHVQKEQSIDFKTETKSNSDMYRGESKVVQEGEKGTKHVEYKIVRENGQVVSRDVVNEEIVKEPVDKVVEQGTKVRANRGSGQFLWPAVGGRITSNFGPRWGRMHNGMDIAGVSDRSILAADNGVVEIAQWNDSLGNYIVINHNNGYKTLYGHLSSINVQVGQTVSRGQRIGVMGTTGRSTGIHLHFEVHRNGTPVNPRPYVSR